MSDWTDRKGQQERSVNSKLYHSDWPHECTKSHRRKAAHLAACIAVCRLSASLPPTLHIPTTAAHPNNRCHPYHRNRTTRSNISPSRGSPHPSGCLYPCCLACCGCTPPSNPCVTKHPVKAHHPPNNVLLAPTTYRILPHLLSCRCPVSPRVVVSGRLSISDPGCEERGERERVREGRIKEGAREQVHWWLNE